MLVAVASTKCSWNLYGTSELSTLNSGDVSWKAWQAVFWECLVRTFSMSTEKFGGLLGSTAGTVSVSCQTGN